MNNLGPTSSLKLSQELLAGIGSRIPSTSSFTLGASSLFLFTLVNEEIQIEQGLHFLKAFIDAFPALPATHKAEELRVKQNELAFLMGKIEGILDYNVQSANDHMNEAIQLYALLSTLLAEECCRKPVIEKISSIPTMSPTAWDGVDIETIMENFKTAKERVFKNSKVDRGWALIEKAQKTQKNIMKVKPANQATVEFRGIN